MLLISMDQHCRDGSIHSEDSMLDLFEISDKLDIHSPRNHHYWRIAFTHASTSSKCILFSMRSLIQLFEGPWTAEWIVSETIDWLKVRNPGFLLRSKKYSVILTFGKNQTADPQPQDWLIAQMEGANKKIEEAIATQKQRDIDEDLRRSAEWASVIQRSQTT
jgi:hypothetical protein